jgi:hypothetical protein
MPLFMVTSWYFQDYIEIQLGSRSRLKLIGKDKCQAQNIRCEGQGQGPHSMITLNKQMDSAMLPFSADYSRIFLRLCLDPWPCYQVQLYRSRWKGKVKGQTQL